MGSDDGMSLICAGQRIADLEELVASLSKKIEDLEAENSGLQKILKQSRKYRKYANAEAHQQSLKRTTKSSYDSESRQDVEVIHLEVPMKACTSNERSEEEEAQEIELDQLMNNALDIFPMSAVIKQEKGKGDLSHYSRKHVALKIMYQGERFHGFASQASNQRTVEAELFTALEKTKLIVGGRVEAKYTRCGRTDKGVSANGQVVALLLRSYHKDPDSDTPVLIPEEDRVTAAIASRSQESEFAKLQDNEEIDYVAVLNRALPMDIRVLGWCYVPCNFHARFSCLSREYHYIFINDGLDIEEMRVAAAKFKGEHDFRNFCKMDADNVHNYRREILSFDIIPCVEEWKGANLWMFRVKGTAFLWHQVRCMVAVLFMIGQRKESSSMIDELLDVRKTTRKPQYVMAAETGLVLQSCEFKGISFHCSPGSARSLHLHYDNIVRGRVLAAAMLNHSYDQFHISNGSENFEEATWKKIPHVRLSCRPTEPTYEERRMNLLSKKQPKP